MRERSYSYSPPSRDYGRRRRSPSPRGRYSGRDRDLPTSLLVRNLRRDCREPRGFGFVQYFDPADAEDAQYQMDGQIFDGRRLTVVFAEENRKKPEEMRRRDRTRSRSYDRRRSSYHSRSPRYSRPRSGRDSRSLSRSPAYYSPSPRRYSRSPSPLDRKSTRSRSYLRSHADSRSRSPADDYYRGRQLHRGGSVSESE